MNEFWRKFYEAIVEMVFSDKIYVFKEIVNEPKTTREISKATGIPYMTVRKYIRWAQEKGLAIVAGTKKIESVLAEKWLLTFVPEVVDVQKDIILRIKLKIRMRREFCENICPLKNECSTYAKIKNGEEITPYRVVTINMGMTISQKYKCKYCKSTNVIKYGKRRNKSKIVQIFLCKSCGRFFSENTTYEKTKLKELARKVSINLHLSGLSYRTIQRHLKDVYGIKVSHVTIYNWVRKSTQEH